MNVNAGVDVARRGTSRWIRIAALTAVAAAAGLAGGIWQSSEAAHGSPMMGGPSGGSWQYTCVSNPGDPDVMKYNKLGREGWELVGFKGTSHACFKKPGAAVDSVALPTDKRYDTEAAREFAELAAATGGRPYGAPTASEVPAIIRRILDENVPAGAEVDLAFVIDTTGSMYDDMDAMKAAAKDLLDMLGKRTKLARVGVVLYRDKGDDYVSRIEVDFTRNFGIARAGINRITTGGGGDWPEHVYSGLMTAMNELVWSPSAARFIILMGDATPHEDYYEWPTRADVIGRATKWGGEVVLFPVVVGR